MIISSQCVKSLTLSDKNKKVCKNINTVWNNSGYQFSYKLTSIHKGLNPLMYSCIASTLSKLVFVKG